MSYLRKLCPALILTPLLLAIQPAANSQTPADRWYQNPLGFHPVNLHTSMGFILPAIATGALLLFTKKEKDASGKLSFYNETGFSWGYKYPYTFLPQNNAGINLKLRSWLSAGLETGIFFPSDAYNSTAGFALRPFARFYAIHKSSWKLYFESGGGLIYLTEEFPRPTPQDERTGTHLNGTTKYGIGSEIQISRSAFIIAGIRHLHISNGNTRGAGRNPSHDSNGFFIGFTVPLNPGSKNKKQTNYAAAQVQ